MKMRHGFLSSAVAAACGLAIATIATTPAGAEIRRNNRPNGVVKTAEQLLSGGVSKWAKLVLLLAASAILVGGQHVIGGPDTLDAISASAPSIAPLEVMKAAGPLPETTIADYV
jgi:hypothetical protein